MHFYFVKCIYTSVFLFLHSSWQVCSKYIYMCVYVYIYTCIYIYIWSEIFENYFTVLHDNPSPYFCFAQISLKRVPYTVVDQWKITSEDLELRFFFIILIFIITKQHKPATRQSLSVMQKQVPIAGKKVSFNKTITQLWWHTST